MFVQLVRVLRFNNCQDVAFCHDQHFFIVDLLGFHAVAIVENHDVANFNVQRLHCTVFQDAALTDSDDFATS
ncbi:hypothetical protein D3C75_1255990 [compost metagenome]